jgi:hypothetical protein
MRLYRDRLSIFHCVYNQLSSTFAFSFVGFVVGVLLIVSVHYVYGAHHVIINVIAFLVFIALLVFWCSLCC